MGNVESAEGKSCFYEASSELGNFNQERLESLVVALVLHSPAGRLQKSTNNKANRLDYPVIVRN